MWLLEIFQMPLQHSAMIPPRAQARTNFNVLFAISTRHDLQSACLASYASSLRAWTTS